MLTTPPEDRELIRAQDRGARVYNVGGKSFPSVTAIVQAGEPKPALISWGMKATAEAAVEQYELVGKIIDQDGPAAAIAHLKGAPYRQRNAAGDLGSRLHEICEYEILRGESFPHPGSPEAQAMVEHFRDFVRAMNPNWFAVEAVVYNTNHQYAGTLDAIASLNPPEGDLHELAGVPVIVDFKSGKGIYGSYALQLSAYANATHIVTETGHEPMLPVDLDRAVVVHIVPGGWKLLEVHIDPVIYSAFLDCRNMALWAKETSEQAVGRVLATGRANGGRGVALPKKQEDAPGSAPMPDTSKAQGTRRRIAPPSLAK